MPLGIVEAVKDGHATLEDFPWADERLIARVKKSIEEAIKWEKHRASLDTSLRNMGIESILINEMLRVWEYIFQLIDNEEFSSEYWWKEAKDKYWEAYKNQNLRIFWNHRTYNIVLDWLEKAYWRHMPRKSEVSKYVNERLKVIRYQFWVLEHYATHSDSIRPGEEQD